MRPWIPRSPGVRKEPEILFTHLMEGIGLALDRKGGRMFITDFAGSVYSANLDGSDQKTLLFAQGNLTGIAYAEIPGPTASPRRRTRLAVSLLRVLQPHPRAVHESVTP